MLKMAPELFKKLFNKKLIMEKKQLLQIFTEKLNTIYTFSSVEKQEILNSLQNLSIEKIQNALNKLDKLLKEEQTTLQNLPLKKVIKLKNKIQNIYKKALKESEKIDHEKELLEAEKILETE